MKYEITSNKLNGSILLWYDDINGQLTKMECHAVLEPAQMNYMARIFPLHTSFLDYFIKNSGGATLRLLEEKVTFTDFWEEYAKKENRIDAENAWNKLKPLDQQRAFAYIKRYDSILATSVNRAKMLASTYLNKRIWMDIVN